MRSTLKDGLEENKQAATLGSCKSNNSLVAGGAISKKESGISIMSSTNGGANNSKSGVSNKAGLKQAKKRN